MYPFKAQILLILCFLMMAGPLLPYLEYFLNRNYIKNELCINRNKPDLECEGLCYLKTKLETANKEGSIKNTVEDKTFPFVNFFVQVMLTSNLVFCYSPHEFIFLPCHYKSTHPIPVSLPPAIA